MHGRGTTPCGETYNVQVNSLFFCRSKNFCSKHFQVCIQGFREKNKDLMRQDVLNTLKSSRSALMKSLLGSDPVAVCRFDNMLFSFIFSNIFSFFAIFNPFWYIPFSSFVISYYVSSHVEKSLNVNRVGFTLLFGLIDNLFHAAYSKTTKYLIILQDNLNNPKFWLI